MAILGAPPERNGSVFPWRTKPRPSRHRQRLSSTGLGRGLALQMRSLSSAGAYQAISAEMLRVGPARQSPFPDGGRSDVAGIRRPTKLLFVDHSAEGCRNEPSSLIA